MRAAIYSRFSTDRQNESSIADQVRVCTEHADKHGWQVVERFEDQGISGAALGNRPGILKLQEAAFAGRCNVVLVTDLSRLSRSQGDLSKMIDRLVAKGARIVGVQDGYDSLRRGHKLQAGLSGIIGEAFREMVKDRTYAALESREGKEANRRSSLWIPRRESRQGRSLHRARNIRPLRGRCKLPHDCHRFERASYSVSWVVVETRHASRGRLDGLGSPRDPAQRALSRRYMLECIRMGKGP